MDEEAMKIVAGWHPTHIFDDVIPVLKKAGISEEQIESMFVDNPRRTFGG